MDSLNAAISPSPSIPAKVPEYEVDPVAEPRSVNELLAEAEPGTMTGRFDAKVAVSPKGLNRTYGAQVHSVCGIKP